MKQNESGYAIDLDKIEIPSPLKRLALRAKAQRQAIAANAPARLRNRAERRDWWFGRGQPKGERLTQRQREAEIRWHERQLPKVTEPMTRAA